MESKRQLQIGELLKRNFSNVLQEFGTNIYKNALVSVTQVKPSPDLSLAKIYISVYGVEDKNSIVELLYEHHSVLKAELVRRIRKHVRRIPNIDFYLDDTLDEMYKIEEILSQLRK